MAKRKAGKKALVPKVTFSSEELQILQQEARAVWEEVAYDALQALAEDKGKGVNDVTIPRDEVIELALDAGRMEDRVVRRIAKDNVNDQKWKTDFLKRVRAADYETLIKAVTPAFGFARYGM